MGNSTRYDIPGSEETQFPGARAVGAVTPQERFEVSVRVRAKPGAKDAADTRDDTLPAQRHYLSREEDAAAQGSDPRDLAKVAAFAHANGLAVVESSADRRTVVLSGTAAQFEKAFDVHLQQYEYNGGTYRGRSGTISVPAELAGTVEGVFGLDNRPQAEPHL
jgi:kumamolisin